MRNYDEIANELDSELGGSVERCSYDGDVILWSNPGIHPNHRYNPNNVAVVPLDGSPSKEEIKSELLSHWFVYEA